MKLLNNNFNIYFFQFFGQFGSQIIGFLVSILIVRVSGVEVSGQYYSSYAIMNINLGVIGSGIKTYFYRNGNTKDLPITLLTILLVLILISVLFAPIYVFVLNYNVVFYVFITLIVISFTLMGVLTSYFRLTNQDFLGSVVNLVGPALSFLLIFFIEPDDIQFLTLLIFLGWSPIWVLTIVFLIKRWTPIDFNILYFYFKASIVLILTTLITSIYGNSDIFIISVIDSDASAGFYKMAISITLIVIPGFSIFSFTYLSKVKPFIKSENWIQFKDLLFWQYRVSLVFGLVFFIVSFNFNKFIIQFLYDVNSYDVYLASILLSGSVLFNVLSMVQSYTLLSLNAERYILRSLIYVVFFNVIVNLILIHLFSYIGAALTSLLTQIVIFLLLSYQLKYQILSRGISSSIRNFISL
jgi:O-antigen/teichoic acid export membrane protein